MLCADIVASKVVGIGCFECPLGVGLGFWGFLVGGFMVAVDERGEFLWFLWIFFCF